MGKKVEARNPKNPNIMGLNSLWGKTRFALRESNKK